MASSARQYFTVSEANAQVATLRPLFDRVMQIRAQLKAISNRLDDLGHPLTRGDLSAEEEDGDDLEEEETEESEIEAAGAESDEDEDEGGGEDEELSPEARRDRGHFRALVATLREHIDEIQSTGAVIKDIEIGLVDWYALHNGREVLLCWRYGETEVGWWHELHTGFAGRRPIAELIEQDQGQHA